MIEVVELTDEKLVQAVLTVRDRHPEWPLDLIGDAAAVVLKADQVDDIAAAIEAAIPHRPDVKTSAV